MLEACTVKKYGSYEALPECGRCPGRFIHSPWCLSSTNEA